MAMNKARRTCRFAFTTTVDNVTWMISHENTLCEKQQLEFNQNALFLWKKLIITMRPWNICTGNDFGIYFKWPVWPDENCQTMCFIKQYPKNLQSEFMDEHTHDQNLQFISRLHHTATSVDAFLYPECARICEYGPDLDVNILTVHHPAQHIRQHDPILHAYAVFRAKQREQFVRGVRAFINENRLSLPTNAYLHINTDQHYMIVTTDDEKN